MNTIELDDKILSGHWAVIAINIAYYTLARSIQVVLQICRRF